MDAEEVVVVGADGERLTAAEVECLLVDLLSAEDILGRLVEAAAQGPEQAVAHRDAGRPA